MKIITITIDENGDSEIDLAGYKGKGCHAVQEIFKKAAGGETKKLTQKPEYFQQTSTPCVSR
jgi:hypothetical protein